MSTDDRLPPGVPDSSTIVDSYDLTFDPGDKLNGSLYLCSVRGAGAAGVAAPLAALREAGLWSGDAHKTVPDEQRQAYKDGLQFVEACSYYLDDGHFVIARFDHPKYPSDAGRFSAWAACLEANHARVR